MGHLPPEESAYIATAIRSCLILLKQLARREGPLDEADLFTTNGATKMTTNMPIVAITNHFRQSEGFSLDSKGIVFSFPFRLPTAWNPSPHHSLLWRK
jgi:hypothetical protein